MKQMPIIALPTGLINATTGVWLWDVMPLLTMIPCIPTLWLYYRTRRWADLILFSTGFSLAAVYHVCHIQEEGLQSSTFLGISGPLWRTGDIIVAQWMLARTFGHAVGASHWVTKVLTNTVFPAVCVYYFWTASDQLPMGNIMRTLFAVILAALAAKLLVEGVDTLPKYCRWRGTRALGLFAVGFIAFPMPELFPNHYWFFHSLWHLALAGGYYELYALIEYDTNTVYKKARRHRHVRAKQQIARAVEQAIKKNDAQQMPYKRKVQVPRLHHFFESRRQSAAGKMQHAESADSEASAGTDFDTSESKALLNGHSPRAGWFESSPSQKQFL